MLVLTRNINEILVVGDDVKISILGINGNQVRLGVAAPKNVTVHREEVYNRIQAENNKDQHGSSLIDKDEKTGTVSYIKDDKGFGYIYSPGVDDHLYFHESALIETNFFDLFEGSDVIFKVGHNQKGKVAVEVKAIL